MSKGVLLFAFNIEKVNYYEMAVCCAKRINHFLNLPVTIVTDNESLPVNSTYQFDNVIMLIVIVQIENKKIYGKTRADTEHMN